MNRLLCRIAVVCAVALLASGIARASDVAAMVDRFYDGLATIIERNMQNPDRCVDEVDAYYRENQATVTRIRQEAEKAMEQAAPAIEKYMSMSEEELEALAQQHSQGGSGMHQTASAGTKRYTEALQAFIMKHPMQGMKIANSAMQLVPPSALQGLPMGR